MDKRFRKYFLFILLIGILSFGIHFLYNFSSCAISSHGNGLVCPIGKTTTYWYMWFGFITILSYSYAWSKNYSVKAPKFIFLTFIFLSIIYTIIPFLFSSNGFFYKEIHNTSRECEIWSGYEAGGESYAACYAELWKKTGDVNFCKKSTITWEFGCPRN